VPSNPDDFDDYVDHCIRVYEHKEQGWQLTNLIDMFVRAAMSQPFLESQGVQLAVLMDCLRGTYARSEGKERLIDQMTFASTKEDLRHEISRILKNLFPDTNSKLRRKMLRHVGLFQWYPFGDAVKGMAKSLNMELSDADIDRFVAERDSLVHSYRFSDGKDPLTACNEMTSLVSAYSGDVVHRFRPCRPPP